MFKQFYDFMSSNIDFSAYWQGFVNVLPLIAKIAPILAIITFIINIPTFYARLRGIILRIEVKRFTLVERDPGLVDFQLNICLHASHGKAVIKGVYLVNIDEFHLLYNEPICLYNEPDNNQPSNKAIIKLAMPMIDFQFTQLVEDKFEELLKSKLNQSQLDILGLEIPEKSFKCLTIAGRLKGRIIGGNFSNIPLVNWNILVEYGTDKWKRSANEALNSLIINNIAISS